MMQLNTRRFLTKQQVDILHTSLKIEKKSLLDSMEYEIPFENIHHKKRIQTTTNDNLLVIAFSMLVIGLFFLFGSNIGVSAFAMTGGTCFLALALLTRKKTVTILTYDGSTIELPFTSKTKPDVVEFSDKIIEASNHFLLNKYGKTDKALPLEAQISKLEFLRDRNILTDEEYDQLKNQLLGRENKSSIGFSR